MIKGQVEFSIGKITGLEQALNDIISNKISSVNSSFEVFKDIIINAIEATPEFLSLGSYAHGDLAPEFGFINADAIISKLLIALRNAILVDLQYGNSYATLTIILDKDILLANEVAAYKSKQYDIEWLRWLLEEGATTIISDYEIAYNLNDQQYRNSRSKAAVMVEGSGWGIPSEFAGVDGNNFITRAIDTSVLKQIEDAFRRILK